MGGGNQSVTTVRSKRMGIEQLISLIGTDADCKVLRPTGLIPPDGRAPDDMIKFYTRCGGLELFPREPFGFRIVSPKEFLPANPLLKGEFYIKHKSEFDHDISADWFVVARGINTEECVTIDLNPSRVGFCYDSFWDVYATPDSKLVAKSFSELIERLYQAKGTLLYWEDRTFDLGKAYGGEVHEDGDGEGSGRGSGV